MDGITFEWPANHKLLQSFTQPKAGEPILRAIPKLPKNGGPEVLAALPSVLLVQMRWTGLSLADGVTLERAALRATRTRGVERQSTEPALTIKIRVHPR